MLYVTLALLAALFGAFSSVSAQPTPPRVWYFATLPATKQIVAYSVNGDSHNLMTGEAKFGMRVNGESALYVVTPPGGEAGLYRFTPDQATAIATPAGDDLTKFHPLASFGIEVVLRQTDSLLPGSALLIDSASARAVPLTGKLQSPARFSDDGQFLRYLSVDDNHTWSLIERTIATDQERVIYSFQSTDPLLIASATLAGDQWIIYDQNRQMNLIALDGTITNLGQMSRQTPQRKYFFNNYLVTSDPTCSGDCALNLGRDLHFSYPGDGGGFPVAEPQVGQTLLVERNHDWLLLDAAGGALPLGQTDSTHIFTPVLRSISPDGRYLLTFDGTDRYTVWDLVAKHPIVKQQDSVGAQISFLTSGFLLQTFGNKAELAYRYSDQPTIDLPNSGSGLYFDLLPDGSLLYALTARDSSVGAPGIYRYDPATQTYSLVLADAQALYPQPLTP